MSLAGADSPGGLSLWLEDPKANGPEGLAHPAHRAFLVHALVDVVAVFPDNVRATPYHPSAGSQANLDLNKVEHTAYDSSPNPMACLTMTPSFNARTCQRCSCN